jgi:hypothetical protein
MDVDICNYFLFLHDVSTVEIKYGNMKGVLIWKTIQVWELYDKYVIKRMFFSKLSMQKEIFWGFHGSICSHFSFPRYDDLESA